MTEEELLNRIHWVFIHYTKPKHYIDYTVNKEKIEIDVDKLYDELKIKLIENEKRKNIEAFSRKGIIDK